MRLAAGKTVVNLERIRRDVILIGGSAGGIEALLRILEQLPADLPAAVGVVLHRSASHATRLSGILARRSLMPLVEPDRIQAFRRGTVYLAPPDRHMLVEDGLIRLSGGPREHRTRPAIDPLFRSASEAYGNRTAGLVLSGLGTDGVEGLTSIKKAGGISLAQNPIDADFPAMPANAINYDDVDAILNTREIPGVLRLLAAGDVLS